MSIKARKQRPIVEDVFDVLHQFRGVDFTMRRVHKALPHYNGNQISAALVYFRDNGVLEQVGTVVDGSRMNVYNVHDLSPRNFTAAPKARKRNRKSGYQKQTNTTPHQHPYDKEIDGLVNDLLELASKIEALRLSNISDTDIAREYQRRKRQKGGRP